MASLFKNDPDTPHFKSFSGTYQTFSGTYPENGTNISIENGFYFILVTNGTASLSYGHRSYTLVTNNLLILTPSIRAILTRQDKDFAMTCLYFEPEYFDTLSAGQIIYNHISMFTAKRQLPLFIPDPEQASALKQTMEMFSGKLDSIYLYHDGATRHLCSFLMIQIYNAIYMTESGSYSYIRRSSEIFRNFKRLLMNHYRKQHNIRFYADQLNITTTYLSRIVRHTTGHTVRFHISELLCRDARRLLEFTDKDVKEIADFLGFSDQSVFGKFFTRQTGMSPIKFRMNHPSRKEPGTDTPAATNPA